MSVTHDEGVRAQRAGRPIVDCPYPWPSPAAEKWVRGWVGTMVAGRMEEGLRTPRADTWRTDGCSVVRWPWRIVTGRDPRWSIACVEHDVAYWLGDAGDLTRAQADTLLYDRIRLRWDSPGWGLVYRLAVRLVGGAWTQMPWRWGYGWD